MKVTIWVVVSLFLVIAMVTAEDEEEQDYVDTDTEEDPEKDMKCDACTIIAAKFSEFFASAEKEKGGLSFGKLKEDDIIEAAEATCDQSWEGFGTIVKDGIERLAPVNSKDDTLDTDAIWPRRLQDFCDELLAESQDEKALYNQYRGGEKAFEDFLCRGEGLYTACTAENWGPWPGDDYDDYEDNDFDYVHDEF